ncbi:small ribosomal subunit protein mS31 isoform X2 [Zophobas morio]|uniref:small ribosomal subunit protein mS31 isoform X2 n=1 Tax=Zophobas morio TaxID=2755281 RepID=UPI003083D7D4
MSRIYLITHLPNNIKNTFHNVRHRTLQKVSLCTSSSSSSDDDTKLQKKVEEKKKSKEALDKLNKLLLTMTEDDVSSKTKLNLAQPTNKRQKKLREKQDFKESKATPTETLVNAANNVAESIGGDVKQTQSELLMKLLNVANGDATVNTNLKDLVKGMKIDQESAQGAGLSKAQQVRQILQEQSKAPRRKGDMAKPRSKSAKSPKRDVVVEKISLFGSEPLGIFSPNQNDLTEGVVNKTWNHLYDKDLKLAVTHPPSNYFQQMILWTEQKKIWKFPIDNEQGLEEEKKVYFTDHVFLEKHLEPWCPLKGPIRHFMELVCVGLSKNPYLTVEAKKEHVLWFREYFKDKLELLQETGAIQETDLGKLHADQKQSEH